MCLMDSRAWLQVTAHYVAMTPNGRVFDSSLDRGFPYDIRVGSGQVIAEPHTGPNSVKIALLRISSLRKLPLSLNQVPLGWSKIIQ